MTTALDGEGLLREIIASPEDVGLRLIYADWLEEHGGDPARAHAIRHDRLGIDAPQFQRWCSCPTLRAVFGQNEYMGRPVVPLYHIATFTESLGGEVVSGAQLGDWQFGVRKGFPWLVRLPLAAWQEHGPALVRSHPITRVELSDREPCKYLVTGGYGWSTDRPSRHDLSVGGTAALPHAVYVKITDYAWSLGASVKVFESEKGAVDGASAACLAWAKAEAKRRSL